MSDDPTNPYEGYTEPDPIIKQLQHGLKLFEQLKNVEAGSAAIRAVNEGALSEEDLKAIVLAQVFTFRQQADDPDRYARWSSR
jgi:hypothetical protein